VACICLFIGAMGKSAQFPLHVWLPDSMEGPTPISALIHAATMVTAGIFMVARMSPLFELSDTALNVVLVIGSITALFMGFMGIIQNDIKRVVAYSTLSQLGYMTVALGVSAYSVAVFHLMTHAFFKALLFLAAGSVIIGMHHDQDIRNMGGLRKHMPITWITSLLGSLALIGTPLFAGFYSKDSIMHRRRRTAAAGRQLRRLWAVIAGVFVTAFYSFRMYFLVFHGEERFHHKPFPPADDHAHGHDDEHDARTARVAVGGDGAADPAGRAFGGDRLPDDPADAVRRLPQGRHHRRRGPPGDGRAGRRCSMARWPWPCTASSRHPFWLAVAGVVTAWWFYLKAAAHPGSAVRTFAPLRTVLENKYYMDWFNENVLAAGAAPGHGGCGRAGTRRSSTGPSTQRRARWAASRDGSARCRPDTSIGTRWSCCWASSP
jgi:NADH-quinone oxidoreductase subunit L